MFFEEKNWALVKMCKIVVGPTILKCPLLKLPQKILPVTIKLAHKKLYLTFSKVSTTIENIKIFLSLFKSKNKRETEKIVFAFTMGKTNYSMPILGVLKI